ncbi:unnamed protein product [Ostreobium quekettii]|uniref:Cyanobacterial aminoacyl-tRNA synthetase CAAD domain-containing protein n=1 Tax=Ostreobium quekettii TaxID=121088 RepID=A0A8S1IP72_9CHLO|nr:unnamed protein product [Ostreobium quekettii]
MLQGVAARRSVLARAEGVKKPAYEFDTDNLVSDLKEKWDALEDKPTVITYGAGALVVLWVASGVVSVVNSIPLVPKAMELVGLVYSAWFVYRYLLFKSSREELLADIESLKEKISGDSGTY